MITLIFHVCGYQVPMHSFFKNLLSVWSTGNHEENRPIPALLEYVTPLIPLSPGITAYPRLCSSRGSRHWRASLLWKSTSCSWGQLWCSGGQSQAQTRTCVVPGPCVSSSGTFRINLILGVNQRPLWVPGHMPMRSFRGLQLGFILWRVTERKNCILQASVLFLPQDYIRLGFQNGTDKLIVYDTQWHWAQGELRDMSYQQFLLLTLWLELRCWIIIQIHVSDLIQSIFWP